MEWYILEAYILGIYSIGLGGQFFVCMYISYSTQLCNTRCKQTRKPAIYHNKKLPLAPKQWSPTKEEANTPFESWQQIFKYVLSLDQNFETFMDEYAWSYQNVSFRPQNFVTATEPKRNCVAFFSKSYEILTTTSLCRNKEVNQA